MCRYFENSQEFPQEFFQRNTFIELGSGIGLLGIAFATVGSSITLTDQAKMISLLKQNVRINIRESPHRVKVLELTWGASLPPVITSPFSVIIGSDVTYECDHIQALIDTLLALSNDNTIIYIGYEERNMDSERIFLNLLDKYFQYKAIDVRTVSKQFREFKGWIYRMKRKESTTQS